MTTMAMESPEVMAAQTGDGTYRIHPAFSMAGQWRLEVSLLAPGGDKEHTSFDVGVRWR